MINACNMMRKESASSLTIAGSLGRHLVVPKRAGRAEFRVPSPTKHISSHPVSQTVSFSLDVDGTFHGGQSSLLDTLRASGVSV